MLWIIDSFNSLAESISNYISLALEILVYALFYPVIMTAYWLSGITHLIIDPFIDYTVDTMDFGNTLFDFLFSVLGSILPFKLGVLFFAGLTLIILYRIYHFVKHVSILGFKI